MFRSNRIMELLQVLNSRIITIEEKLSGSHVDKNTVDGKSLNQKERICPKCFSNMPLMANYCPICGERLIEFEIMEKVGLGINETVVTGVHDKSIQIL